MEGVDPAYRAEVMGGLAAIKTVLGELILTFSDINGGRRDHHRTAHPAERAVAAKYRVKPVDKFSIESDGAAMTLG
jgi:hypothetical protein